MKHRYPSSRQAVKRVGLCLILIANFLGAQAQFTLTSQDLPQEVSLHEHAQIANLENQNVSINQILQDPNRAFTPLTQPNTDLGFTAAHYWIRFAIHNTTAKQQIYYLEACRPIVDFATLYTTQDQTVLQVQKSGDAIPYEAKSFKSRKTIFKITLQPQQQYTYYLHLKSDGEVINAGITLRSIDNLLTTTSLEQMIFGIFYGILVIAAIIYLFFFFAMKERSFLYYSLYVTFIGMLQFALDGLFYQLITPQAGWLSLNSVILSACLANFFLGRYAQVFLKIKQYNTTINNLFYVVFALDFILFASLFIHPAALQFSYPIANALGLCLLMLIIASIVSIYRQTHRIDGFFATGIFFLIAGFVVFILKNFSVLPVNFYTENGSKLGTGVEVIFLSLSMANLIRKLRDDRENLQRIALQKSEEMNEMKSYFLSNISHELRTPLNAILNLSKEMSTTAQDETIQKNSQIIKESSYALLSSVNDILDFSKIEKGEIKLDSEKFNIKEVLQHLTANAAQNAKNKGLGFNTILPENMPQWVLGDKMRLTQMVNNILNNALKFTTHGFINCTVTATQNPDKTLQFQIAIADTGVGIPKEKMDSIFESFTQETTNNKRKFGGLGLGLYIVKTLTNLHHGSIDLQSIPNQGTVCKLTLNYTEVEVQETKIEEPVTLNYDLKGTRILVVEDNAMNQMVLKMITKKWDNTTVSFANNGQEGLNKLKEQPFDIILMDLQMPVMDGYEATTAIRSGAAGLALKNIPIIALTADVMETTKDRVFQLGMNKYMTKPVDKDLLFTNIYELTVQAKDQLLAANP